MLSHFCSECHKNLSCWTNRWHHWIYGCGEIFCVGAGIRFLINFQLIFNNGGIEKNWWFSSWSSDKVKMCVTSECDLNSNLYVSSSWHLPMILGRRERKHIILRNIWCLLKLHIRPPSKESWFTAGCSCVACGHFLVSRFLIPARTGNGFQCSTIPGAQTLHPL